jgi:hypothetical protein
MYEDEKAYWFTILKRYLHRIQEKEKSGRRRYIGTVLSKGPPVGEEGHNAARIGGNESEQVGGA